MTNQIPLGLSDLPRRHAPGESLRYREGDVGVIGNRRRRPSRQARERAEGAGPRQFLVDNRPSRGARLMMKNRRL